MAWSARDKALRNACDAEVRAKLKKIDAAPRSPHLPDLPAGLALECVVPWRKGAHPPAHLIAELHLAGSVFLLFQRDRIVAKFAAKVAFDAQHL